MSTFDYRTLVMRNAGFISPDAQETLRRTSIVIAGCGMGSFVAEALVRMGSTQFTLIDGDTVDAHNLNRQNFTAEDIGTPKVVALANRLRAVNPSISVRTEQVFLDSENTTDLLEGADFIIDTIDFLDLPGITALHATARTLGIPVISTLNIGFGSGCVYFPPHSPYTFERIFNINKEEENPSYVEKFTPLIQKLSEVLDPQVVRAMASALTIMEDGKPCPASQVSAGTFSAGAFTATLVVRILSGLPVTPAPALLIANLTTTATEPGINLLG